MVACGIEPQGESVLRRRCTTFAAVSIPRLAVRKQTARGARCSIGEVATRDGTGKLR